MHFLEWKCVIFFIKISLKFVPKGPVNNIPALVQMAPIKQQAIIWANDGLAYWCKYASLSLNELTGSSLYQYQNLSKYYLLQIHHHIEYGGEFAEDNTW